MAIASKRDYTLEEFCAQLEESDRLTRELPVARDMQDELVAAAQDGIAENFALQQTAAGEKWPAHSQITVKIYGPHPILILSGDMLKAATMTGVKGNYMSVEDRSIILGVDLPYAATHQFGDPSRNIPQRRFFDVPPEAKRNMASIAAGYYVRELVG